MNLKVPIVISDELTDEVVMSTGLLDLASGDIERVEYEDHDVALHGLPCEAEDYEFTSGVLSHGGKDVEFRVDVNKTSGVYSVSASELLEIKVRAAALFAGVSGEAMLAKAEGKAGGGASAPAGTTPPTSGKARGGRQGRMH